MPAPSDWLTTTWQTLPRVFRVARHLAPTLHLPDATTLDARFLDEHAVAALLWDVDGTLMAYHERAVAPALARALRALDGRVPQAILSNCGEERLRELGAIFPELPVLKAYAARGGPPLLRRLERGEERWSTGLGAERRDVARPDGRLRALKKPSAELIALALDHLAVDRRAHAFMVGDQYFTDVAGANFAGIRSIKVRTLEPRSFPLPIRAFHLVERALYRALHGRVAAPSRARTPASPE